MKEHHDVIAYLDRIESKERIKDLPHLTCRAPNIEISDINVVVVNDVIDRGDDRNDSHDNRKVVTTTTSASLRKMGLKEFHTDLLCNSHSISRLNDNSTMSLSLTSLLSLDVSNNELCDLPGLKLLTNLTRLSIQRNWFANLPSEIGHLNHLQYLDASRNFLRPNEESLWYEKLRQLTNLQVLELSYNRKIRRADHRESIRLALDPVKVEVVITVWEEMCNHNNNNGDEEAVEKEGDMSKLTTATITSSYIGASAAMRNPLLLRSQLEPLSTFQLRRRLVMDFGEMPTDPSIVDRACVVQRLLTRYHNEGLSYFDSDNGSSEPTIDINMALAKRTTLRLHGTPVNEELLHNILAELKEWRVNKRRGGGSGQNRERPSIDAECYMILRASSMIPNSIGCSDTASEILPPPSRAARRMSKKMNCNIHLWSLALEALRDVDSEFASRCSEIAVTFGFTGSPHVDRQNSSPFYGLALGEFTEGTGCVAVECSARVICEINTKNRLGKIDGRYPHWVTEYNPQQERYSLIYYDTLSAYETPGPAIFGIP